MSDLIERLRGTIRWNDIELAREAADALEELRARHAARVIAHGVSDAEIEQLRADLERHKKALQKYAGVALEPPK